MNTASHRRGDGATGTIGPVSGATPRITAITARLPVTHTEP
jgi:hypothetical protein